MKNFEAILTEAAVVSDALNRGKLLSWLLGGFVALSLLLNLVLGYALLHVYPIKEFLWTSDARAVCAAIPLSEPMRNCHPEQPWVIIDRANSNENERECPDEFRNQLLT